MKIKNLIIIIGTLVVISLLASCSLFSSAPTHDQVVQQERAKVEQWNKEAGGKALPYVYIGPDKNTGGSSLD